MAYNSLVISGGGVKGIAALGALHYFYTQNDLDKIDTYVGTSVGSVICLLLICGYTPTEILNDFMKIDIIKNMKVDIWGLLNTYGLVNIDALAENILFLVRKKLDYVPTLRKLFELTGKKLVVSVSNVTKGKAEYFSIDTTPNISCLDAIKMSCNIPFLFKKQMYNNNLYVDGGLLDNFPILCIDDGKNNVLGINLLDSDNIIKSYDQNLIGYIYKIIDITMREICKIKTEKTSPKCTIINLIVDVNIMNITIDQKTKMDIFLDGYNSAKLDMELKNWDWDN